MAVTTTVIPGYTLADGETVTTAKLNLLARPSVTVTGALDGDTPVTIGDNSITGIKLVGSGADAVCDEVTIEQDGDSKLRVKDHGITAVKLANTLDLSAKSVTLPPNSATATVLAEESVESDAIVDSAVITRTIAAGAVTADKIAAGVIGSTQLETNAPYFAAGTFNSAGTLGSGAKNIASVAEASTGLFTVTFTTVAANTRYLVLLALLDNSGNGRMVTYKSKAVGSVAVQITTSNGALNSTFAEISIVVIAQ